MSNTKGLTGLKGMSIYYQAGVQYWGYQKVSTVTRVIADKLIATYGHQGVKDFSYRAIPRGGHIILGLLLYYLNIPTANTSATKNGSPLVIVDDCSLTGLRFGQFLCNEPHAKVIFAHLTSHPDLREALMQAEPRVMDVIAGHDAIDIGQTLFPNEAAHQAWREHWFNHLDGKRYWMGILQAIVFPWGEPDRYYWNSETKQFENDWFFASPDRAIKNLNRFNLPAIPIKTHPCFRCPDEVAYKLISETRTLLCNFKTNQVFQISEVTSDMWRSLVVYGTEESALSCLQHKYSSSAEEIHLDLNAFTAELIHHGLLEKVGG